MTRVDEHLSREGRRRRTEAAILRAASELFAESGFERTTIRGVASRAGIDPALVMQHFGNKERLFAAAACWSGGHERILRATSDSLPSAVVSDLLEKFEGPGSEAAIALLRNCLTHPSAAEVMRDEVMRDRTAAVAAVLDGEDAELRAALLGACVIGLAMGRYLLELPPLVDASEQDLRRVVEPLLRALVDAPATCPADGPLAGGVRDPRPGAAGDPAPA